MEWYEKRDLEAFMLTREEHDGALSEEQIWRFMIEICFGLQYLHSNKILHRDLKPLNVFLAADLSVRIGDVGEARQLLG